MTHARGYEAAKRVSDIVFAAAGLVLTSPIQVGIALLVAKDVGRPVLFRQSRPGLDGNLFRLVKFRTMHAPDPSRGLTDDASRLSSLGRILRETSLDELPTLWNVLKGDMSLVGPRPLLPEYMDLYSPRQAMRHRVRPGITGLAQVSGRNGLDWETKLELDARYVETRSIRADARILAATIATVFRRDGISENGQATMTPFTGSVGSSVSE